MPTVVALPTNFPGGLEAEPSEHFGRCDVYTLVTIEGDRIGEVKTLDNQPHDAEGCLGPVRHLEENGVRVLISAGMGMRPLMGFGEAGILVLHDGGAETVREAVTALTRGLLRRFGREHMCHGGDHAGGCH